MKREIGRITLIILTTVFLSGCGFWSTRNNTELKLQNNTEAETHDNTEIKQNDTEVKQNNTELEIQNETKKIQNETEVKTQSDIEVKQDNTKNVPKIIDKLVTWGFSVSEERKIDTIIIHSSYNAVGTDTHNLEDIIYKEYKPAGVSPHYIISHEGKIYRLVVDKNIAYHAGESKVPDGRTGVNNFSIGIEIVNTKSEKPNDAQYSALNNLLAYLKKEYKIKYVLGHDDIAPSRKDDPWNFDFEKIK